MGKEVSDSEIDEIWKVEERENGSEGGLDEVWERECGEKEEKEEWKERGRAA